MKNVALDGADVGGGAIALRAPAPGPVHPHPAPCTRTRPRAPAPGPVHPHPAPCTRAAPRAQHAPGTAVEQALVCRKTRNVVASPVRPALCIQTVVVGLR
ncbi:hypothetical protein GCM10022262_29020 [Georgenia daeguensis]|uniref:Uncharacterized protein n=1 Tax=Georgenia daeguensis TaxID=908355 RepID=A0ABP8EX12_9MICO